MVTVVYLYLVGQVEHGGIYLPLMASYSNFCRFLIRYRIDIIEV